MSVSISQLQELIDIEYEHLVRRLHLVAIARDVYKVDDEGTGRKTLSGTDVRNATPGCKPRLVVLPQEPGDLREWSPTQPVFPPTNWDRYTDEWPMWRIELWHEVVHQYQDQILGLLDAEDATKGHTKGWPQAIAAVAGFFGIDAPQLRGVL